MENARLFDNEARRSAQLCGLNRIENELPKILDLEDLLQTVARLLLEVFDYQSVEVYWVDRLEGTVGLRSLAGLAAGKCPWTLFGQWRPAFPDGLRPTNRRWSATM